MSRPRVLLFTNSIENRYGYSVAGNHIVNEICKNYDVFVLGMQSIHPPYNDKKTGITYLGINTDPFGSDCLEDYLKIYKIDVLVTMLDIWIGNTDYLIDVIKRTKVKWICHITLNSSPLSKYFINKLNHADVIVAPSKYNFNLLKEAGYKNIVCIPHCVDTKLFKPKKKEKHDTFTMLSVMRNKGMQKDFPALFESYRIFLNGCPDAVDKTKLLILSDPLEREGVNLYTLRESFGLTKNVYFINAKPNEYGEIEPCLENEGMKHNPNMNFSADKMVDLYNLVDCHVISSGGESFSLPTLEAMACGLPVIMPKNSTSIELVEDTKTGLLVDCIQPTLTPLMSYTFPVDKLSLANCMITMYRSKSLRKVFSNNALMTAKGYDVKNVIHSWTALVTDILHMDTDYSKRHIGL